MRLGGPNIGTYTDPESWSQAVRQVGYSAAYCPVQADADAVVIQAYAQAAQSADIIIAEVGVWNNPLSPNEAERQAALAKCQRQLALADEIGARCCVNIAGSRGEQWDGPHPDNLTVATFDLIVESVRTIIDAVQPKRTYYTLETMPWAYPDSADSYLRLIAAIDRPRFAVHLDPVNLINSPWRYFNTAAVIRDCVEKLGPHIKSCHAKDIVMSSKLTVHLDEVRPGLGMLAYPVLLHAMHNLDVPVMLEHLDSADAYQQAAAYVRQVADSEQIPLI
jgi:sugar phosphate isomerase/epimerase